MCEEPPARKTFILAAAVLAATFVTGARADNGACENLGRIGTMLRQIDSHCPGYGLTAEGQKLRLTMTARIVPIGGEACTEKGKAAMLRDLGEINPAIEAAAHGGCAPPLPTIWTAGAVEWSWRVHS